MVCRNTKPNNKQSGNHVTGRVRKWEEGLALQGASVPPSVTQPSTTPGCCFSSRTRSGASPGLVELLTQARENVNLR